MSLFLIFKMIYSIEGKITEKDEKYFVLENNKIGYLIFAKSSLINKLAINDNLKIFTHFHIKEDSQQLYGFEEIKERDFFKMLITVSGVGPKLAMETMEMPINQIKKAIFEKNHSFLSQIKGLGNKTAQKIILELNTKISQEEIIGSNINGGFYSEEVFFALQNLGFRRNEIFERLQKLPNGILETEEIVRWFLKKT